jgi:hypothetical protein
LYRRLNSYDDDFSTALQFAAKLHELAMQASIVEALLCLVRIQLEGSFVPLGALSVAIQATQVSYLWSLDFFSVFRSRTLQGWRKAIFVIVMPALVGLTALVGPSSAVLMIPRSGTPRVVWDVTKFSNESVETLYRSRIGTAEGFNLYVSCLLRSVSTKPATVILFN